MKFKIWKYAPINSIRNFCAAVDPHSLRVTVRMRTGHTSKRISQEKNEGKVIEDSGSSSKTKREEKKGQRGAAAEHVVHFEAIIRTMVKEAA